MPRRAASTVAGSKAPSVWHAPAIDVEVAKAPLATDVMCVRGRGTWHRTV